MPVQAYVDDSGGKGHGRYFVLASLIADSEHWALFSDEWQQCLDEQPAIKYFKMREAAGPNGQFAGFTEAERDQKLRLLARIINRHVKIATHSTIDLDAHAQTWGLTNPKPLNEPYFFPFQATILAACHELWDLGWRERFEIIFDEHVIFGPRAKALYPLMKDIVRYQTPEQASILPIEPIFRCDDEFLPIQAADLFAWCWRKGAPEDSPGPFSWLWEEMGAIKVSNYSQFYDLERMRSVAASSVQQAEAGFPPELIDKYKGQFRRPKGK